MNMTKAEGRAKGGVARARSLTKEKRQEIARKGGEAKAEKARLPKATHAGELTIGDVRIQCSVLEDGVRVLSLRGINTTFGGSYGGGVKSEENPGGRNLPRFLSSNALKPFISSELMARLSTPIEFRPMHGGRTAFGYDGSLLPEICEVILDASSAHGTRDSKSARTAELLVRGFARVGIVALIDEATGYQCDRAKDALAKILEAFIAKELQAWVRTFPTEYYQELFRLRGLLFPGESVKRPQYFGLLTNDIVYKRLAPGVLDELRRVTPRNDDGRPKAKYFQSLTSNAGYPKLREHLGKVIAIMQLSDNYQDFKIKLDRLLPPYTDQLRLQLDPVQGQEMEDDGKGI